MRPKGWTRIIALRLDYSHLTGEKNAKKSAASFRKLVCAVKVKVISCQGEISRHRHGGSGQLLCTLIPMGARGRENARKFSPTGVFEKVRVTA